MLVQVKCLQSLIAGRRSSLSRGLSSSSLEQVVKAYTQVNQCLVLKCQVSLHSQCCRRKNLLILSYPPEAALWKQRWIKRSAADAQTGQRNMAVRCIDVRAAAVGWGSTGTQHRAPVMVSTAISWSDTFSTLRSLAQNVRDDSFIYSFSQIFWALILDLTFGGQCIKDNCKDLADTLDDKSFIPNTHFIDRHWCWFNVC